MELNEIDPLTESVLQNFAAINAAYQNVQALAKLTFEKESEYNQKRADNEKLLAELKLNLGKNVFDSLQTFLNAQLASEQAAAANRLKLQRADIAAAEDKLKFLLAAEGRASGAERERLKAQRAAAETQVLQEKKGLDDLQAQKEKLDKQAAARKKAFSLAEVALAVAQGIAEATAKYGANPFTAPFLPVAIASIVATGALQVAAIQALPLKRGTLKVPLTPGATPDTDSVPALLTPGEAVIPAHTTKKYFPLLEAIFQHKIPPDAFLNPQNPTIYPQNPNAQAPNQFHVHLDRKGFTAAIQNDINQTTILGKRYSV